MKTYGGARNLFEKDLKTFYVDKTIVCADLSTENNSLF